MSGSGCQSSRVKLCELLKRAGGGSCGSVTADRQIAAGDLSVSLLLKQWHLISQVTERQTEEQRLSGKHTPALIRLIQICSVTSVMLSAVMLLSGFMHCKKKKARATWKRYWLFSARTLSVKFTDISIKPRTHHSAMQCVIQKIQVKHVKNK